MVKIGIQKPKGQPIARKADRFLDKLKREVNLVMRRMEHTSKTRYLTGPRPTRLGVVTGHLRRSVKGFAKKKRGMVIGYLGSYRVKYGPFHEFGFSGIQPVSAHSRTIRKVWGRPIAPKSIHIGAHMRRINYRGKPFLRPARNRHIKEIRGAISKAMRTA